MTRRNPLLLALTFALLSTTAFAENPTTLPSADALAKMPVKEITVFKDGHALLLHSGKMPTDAAGNVLLDNLPAPVLGTFWPFSNDPNVKLASVTAGTRKISAPHTALSYADLLRANIGARVALHANDNYEGTVLKVLDASKDQPDSPDQSAPNAPAPSASEFLLLQTGTGTKVLNIATIDSLLFESPDYKTTLSSEESRNLLTLKLQWPDNKPQPAADVGMMYLQKGIRWIPNYKITIDGNGHANFQLQATLVNEITDLHDVTANLVIGVPTFAFKDITDPIALQKTIAQLSPYFQPNAAAAYGMSNAIMSQGRMSESRTRDEGGGNPSDLGPELGGSQKNEDLFIFTVNHITLKKDERMVVPITQFSVPYADVYTLDIPFSPPPEVWRNFGAEQQAQIARLFRAPKVMHTLRISNTSDFPITTGPALLMRDGKILSQAMTEYTPIHATLDLSLTTAVDVLVKKTDRETKRIPNAERWEGMDFARVDLKGNITLTNHRATPIILEISRNVLGTVDTADNDGKPEMLNLFEDDSFLPTAADADQPTWWGWYNWPNWWTHFNGVGRISWKATLDPGKDLTLNYTWHYLWR
ncbi:MAG TPA: hypothetical protein VM008_09880 [Phycisphaerae bacterium]|nr:hypothetical protein [Phycisphaerae bacterium]